MYNLLLIQAFRPDRLLASAHRLVTSTFGEAFMEEARGHLDLLSIVEQELRPNMPVLLCAVQVSDLTLLAHVQFHFINSIYTT